MVAGTQPLPVTTEATIPAASGDAATDGEDDRAPAISRVTGPRREIGDVYYTMIQSKIKYNNKHFPDRFHEIVIVFQ